MRYDSFADSMAVSPAKDAGNVLPDVGYGISAVYSQKSVGPSTLPCGTPALTGYDWNWVNPYTTRC